MPVVRTETDPVDASFRVVSEFAAPVERVWRLWEDPRQVERWWGPPGYPATFSRHDFALGGRSVYFMTGPDGDQASPGGAPQYAAWRYLTIDRPRFLEIENGFSDESGEPAGDFPWNRFQVDLQPIETGTRMTVTAAFDDHASLARMLDLGMQEGMTEATGQIDAILAEG